MQIVVFEDHAVSRFLPLAELKPLYGLTTGSVTLRDRFERHMKGVGMVFHMRQAVAGAFSEANPGAQVNAPVDEELLLVNGRLLCDAEAARFALSGELEPGEALLQEGELLFARVRRDMVADGVAMRSDLIDTRALARQLRCRDAGGFRLLGALWDLVGCHAEELSRDALSCDLGRLAGAIHPSAVVVEPGNVHVAPGAVVMAGAVLDGSRGFVSVGADAVVEPNAVLMEGVAIGPQARVKACARIYSNVSVGYGSKVGGEVEDSIIEPFANKQHDGFLGHSYLSSWCNLGAGTTTSDLKNNYGEVRLRLGGVEHATGQQFLGLFMAEHSKSAIGTLFNTGTVVGTACNIFGSGLPPKELPSFSWGGPGGFVRHEEARAVETARTVMARRKVAMGPAYEQMFRLAAAGATHTQTIV